MCRTHLAYRPPDRRIEIKALSADRRIVADNVAALAKLVRLFEICVAFPTLSAIQAGSEVFAAVDASGGFSTAGTKLVNEMGG